MLLEQQLENPITTENNLLTKITPQQPPTIPYPSPTKTDILIDIINEREKLKTIREDLKTGARRARKTLTTELYITQLVLSADKIALIGMKETNINLTQNNLNKTENFDINMDGLTEAEKDAVINAGRILIKKSRREEQPNSLH